MTPDDIIAAFKAPGDMPTAALAAAVGHADALAPAVFAVAAKLRSGTYLLPADARLLSLGLDVLAAARHPGLIDELLAMARQPSDDLEQIWPAHTPISLQRLLLSVWDRPAADLFRLIEHGDHEPDVKWALCNVLARLTFDGRITRADTTEFLARIERDGLIDDGDMAWWGWAGAVERLGLTELAPALRRVWAKPVFAHHEKAELEEALADMRAAAADPSDASAFDADDIRAITDPVEAVAWVAQRAAAFAEWDAEHGSAPDTDVTSHQRLTREELGWLSGLLASRQVPPSTMPFEMLDGFLTALVIGPELVPPSQYLPEVWGTDDGSGPAWDTPDQAQQFFDLLMKHWNAIAARRSADAPHAPHIEHFGAASPGEAWADGFLTGIDLRGEAWQPIFDDRRADQVVFPILAMTSDAPVEAREQFTPEIREATIEQLPALLQLIAAYWRSPERRFPPQEPARSSKVGRNEPCPCGSGKKFKKCCGSGSTSTLH